MQTYKAPLPPHRCETSTKGGPRPSAQASMPEQRKACSAPCYVVLRNFLPPTSEEERQSSPTPLAWRASAKPIRRRRRRKWAGDPGNQHPTGREHIPLAAPSPARKREDTARRTRLVHCSRTLCTPGFSCRVYVLYTMFVNVCARMCHVP